MKCPACGYGANCGDMYGNFLGEFGQTGFADFILGPQMQQMDKNYMYLSDEEYDLIWARRDKERRIKKAQLIEEEVWHPELLEGK